MKCNDLVEATVKHGDVRFKNIVKCEAKPFCKVRFLSGINGKPTEQVLCKRHYNALVKRCAKTKEFTGWNAQLTTEFF